jgi:hypothetical protein
MCPPIENEHYIRVDNLELLKKKLELINEEMWNKMSNNCHLWFKQNVLSDNMFSNMMANIYY